MRRLLLCLLLLTLTVVAAQALEVPKPGGYVSDKAGMISQTTELKLDQFLREFENSDSTQIVVLTIPTLEDEALEEFSMKVFENWKIGQLGKDNGALLLIAKKERAIRIEVGYGLEGRLTDLLAGRIIDNEISPRFKQGDFDGGVISGVLAMAEAVRGEYAGSGTSKSKKRSSPFGLIFLIFFVLPLFSRLGGRRSRRSGIFFGGPFIGGGGFGGGGFGGGGFSGGGGGGGGGGASGGW